VSTPDWFSRTLLTELRGWVQLTPLQIEQLYRHYELLLHWNERMNLTTVRPGAEAVIRHYCESLFFAAHLPAEKESIRVFDLGSGGGFPGFPMAVLKPGWRVALVESHKRKAVFLRESARDLSNVSVISERFEEISETADWVIARAVDPQSVVSTVPRLAPKVGLLVSEVDFSELNIYSRIAWAEPVRLPWGDRRICVYGSTWNAVPLKN
jgi:16S rRNA (guanine(527)-N(7))-methyltransferase RsmG